MRRAAVLRRKEARAPRAAPASGRGARGRSLREQQVLVPVRRLRARAAVVAAVGALALGALAVALLGLLAWLSARTTLYVITSRRVIMKIGVALPIFFNIPFTDVASAAVHAFHDGAGDIPLSLTPGRRIAYLHLWPHARPFGFSKPEPAVRSIPSVASVADILGGALMAEARRRQRASGASVSTIVGSAEPAIVNAAYARG